MAILAWALGGLSVGAIARLLRKGHQPIGILWTMILGVVGSLVGGFIATDLLNIGSNHHFGLGSFLIAVATSFLLLALWEPIARRREQKEGGGHRSEEHTSELQSLAYLVCRLLLEKKNRTSRACRR